MTARRPFTARRPQARSRAPAPFSRMIAKRDLDAIYGSDEGYDGFIRADGYTRLGTQIEQRLRDDTPRHREIAGDPSFGERMTLWFRLNGEAATFAFALATVALLFGVVAFAYLRTAL